MTYFHLLGKSRIPSSDNFLDKDEKKASRFDFRSDSSPKRFVTG